LANKKDKLDISMDIKKFFKLIYRDLGQGEYIRVFQDNKKRVGESTYSKVSFFNDIDDLVNCSNSNKNYNVNTYFTLSTTDGTAGAEENLKYRYCLGFDFDKKDLGQAFNHIDILNKFKELKIHYHALLHSGNGYHVYVMINKTNNIKMVHEVQETLRIKLGADEEAVRTTQILRIPYTYNIKDEPKRVNIIHMDDRHNEKFKPYDIEFLYNMNCKNNEVKTGSIDRQIKYTLNNTNIPKCIKDILSNGTQEGDRYNDLQRIVVTLRQRNKPLGEIIQVCKEWAYKSQYDDNLDYRINSIYANLNYISMDCKACEHKQKCYSVVVSDFNFDSNYDVITFENKIAKQLRSSTRKGVKVMEGNKLLIANVLKNNNDGLYKSEIVRKITYKKQCRLSGPTLIKALKSLVDDGTITVIEGNRKQGIENFYKINSIRCDMDNTFNISYLATSMCICRLITPNELRLYHHMRYKHHIAAQEGKAKGNLFHIKMEDLATDLGTDQGNISKMINNLLECHIMDIWERQKSEHNGFEYNIYRLNS